MTPITVLDHLVLTVADIETTARFYSEVLGMRVERFTPAGGGEARTALHFGNQKINLHQAGAEFLPRARKPTPGSADLCFLVATPLSELMAHLRACSVTIEEGPVARSGAQGPIESIYLRDPDGNLIELGHPRG